MTLGQKLKKLRSEANLTQKEVADLLHVSFQTISKWESDTNEPDVATLKELTKLFDCSLDYLLSEDENAPKKLEVSNESSGHDSVEAVPVVTPVQTEVSTNKKMSSYKCAKCGQLIPEDEVVSQDIKKHKRHKTVTVGKNYYHRSCLLEINKSKIDNKNYRGRHEEKIVFVWSIIAGVVGFGVSLAAFLCNRTYVHPALGVLFSVLISYCLFSMIYCILSGSYVGDIFLWCTGLTIKFPGLIFSWDLDGIVWVICMKILFAIIAFLVGVFTALASIVLCSVLGAFSFPFVLIHNNRTNYEDYIF